VVAVREQAALRISMDVLLDLAGEHQRHAQLLERGLERGSWQRLLDKLYLMWYISLV
jgi:hypothetical protein